jgi:hypothetical protein
MTEVEVSRLEDLIVALDVSMRRIKWHPDLSKYVIWGRKGYIRPENGHWAWIAVVDGMSRRYATSVKRKLAFMQPGLEFESRDPDGDNKPVKTCEFRLDRMPTSEEAIVLRKVLGLAKKKVYSEEAIKVLRENAQKARETRHRAISI